MEKKIIRDEALSLEGDGIIPKIYNLLAYKDPSFGTMPSIYLPDTIMFSFNIPEVWYFGNDKGVRKKLKVNVTLENIEKAFLRNVSKNGIVAQYIALGSEQKPVPLTFTYILKDELRAFLHSNKPNGILQKFVNPKGLYNYVLKVNWSPNFCLFEKVENLKKLDDDTTDLYQRTMTLEGRDYQTRTIPLRGSVLPHKLEKLAYHVSHHIKNATMENIIIARMTLVFKIDDEGKLWFLYCTSLRVQPYEDQINENQHTFGSLIKPQNFNVALSSPSTINAYKSGFLKAKSLKKIYKCQNCEKDLDSQQYFNIPLHQVINEYENDRQIHYSEDMKPQKKVVKKYGIANRYQVKPEELDVSDATIPKIIMQMYPDIKQNEYEVLRREPGFLYEEVKVCEDCYLQFSNNFEYVQDPRAIAKEYQSFIPKGTGSLRPDILEQRRTATQAHGKANNNQLGVLLRATKQRKCIPTDCWNTSGQSERSEIGFPEAVRSSYKEKRDIIRKANLHSSMSMAAVKETSQPRITEEEDPFDQSSVESEMPIQVQFTKPIKEISRKTTTSQVAKREFVKSKSPQKNVSVFLKGFYLNKMLTEKNLKPILPQVGSKSTKKRIESPSPDAKEINYPYAFTMTSFRQSARINAMMENSEYSMPFSKSKDRILKTYAGKSFNSLVESSKADITIKDQ